MQTSCTTLFFENMREVFLLEENICALCATKQMSSVVNTILYYNARPLVNLKPAERTWNCLQLLVRCPTINVRLVRAVSPKKRADGRPIMS